MHRKSFCLTIFQQKYWHLSDIKIWNFNKMLTNHIVVKSRAQIYNLFVLPVSLLLPEKGLEDQFDLCRHIPSRSIWSVETECYQSKDSFLWQVRNSWIYVKLNH